jgi:hypothetical protein
MKHLLAALLWVALAATCVQAEDVTELTEETSPDGSDLLYIVIDPATTPANRKITLDNLLSPHTNDSSGAHAASAISFTPSGSISATTVQAAIVEAASEVSGGDIEGVTAGDGLTGGGTSGTVTLNVGVTAPIEVSADTIACSTCETTTGSQTKVDTHVNDTTAAHAASAISVDSTTLVGTGTDVQAVFEELDNSIAAVVADILTQTEANAVDFVTGTATGNISGERVATDTATIDADAGTSGQMKWNVIANSIGPTQVDETADYTFSGKVFLITDIASLPASPSAGTFAIITDGTSSTDCTVGVSSSRVLCEFDGADWVPISGGGGGGGDHGGLTGLDDDDHSAVYVKFESSAGTPTAGSCERAGQLQFDTTNSILYACYDADNPVDIGDQGDSYAQICGDSVCTTASGAETLTIAGGVGLTTVGSADTLTINVDNHVKSVYFPANALTTDGTVCDNPALATINTGPRIYTILCEDSSTGNIYGHLVMPDSWNAGTLTFELEYVQTQADTGALHTHVACQARGNGETISATWGTEVVTNDTNVSGSNIVDHLTSGFVTCAGTPAAGDSVFFYVRTDTGITTDMTTLHIIGIKMEYTVIGAGSDKTPLTIDLLIDCCANAGGGCRP